MYDVSFEGSRNRRIPSNGTHRKDQSTNKQRSTHGIQAHKHICIQAHKRNGISAHKHIGIQAQQHLCTGTPAHENTGTLVRRHMLRRLVTFTSLSSNVVAGGTGVMDTFTDE